MGKVYLCNAFSLNMLDDSKSKFTLSVTRVSEEEVKKLLRYRTDFISAIGHESTARFLSKRLGIPIKANRIQVKLREKDYAIVCQIMKRLPEGAVLSEEELEKVPVCYYIVGIEFSY